MIEHEYQFEVLNEGGENVKIAFHKGTWQIVTEHDEFHVNDTGTVEEIDTLGGAFINTRIEIYNGKNIDREGVAKAIFDYLSGGMLICLLWFGMRMFVRYKESRTAWVWVPYFLSLVPLSLAVAALNHMDRYTFLSTELLALMGTGFAISALCLILAGISFTKIPAKGEPPILQSLAVCIIFISLSTGAILAHTYYTYSQPKVNTMYFK